MKFSVIIPVYNGEKHILNAIKCLQRQTFADWEAVIVDDGSTDGTLALLKSLASEEKRLKIASQPNGGVSKARNKGMDEAAGDWIVWLDADDGYVDTALETIAKTIDSNEGIEAIQFPYREILPDGGDIAHVSRAYGEFGARVYSGKEAFDILFAKPGCSGLNWQPWRFAFRRDRLPRFRDGIIHEDVDVLPVFLYGLEKVYISKDALYLYRPAREGAATAAFSAKRAKDILDVTGHVYSSIEPLDMNEETRKNFKARLACNLFGFYLASPGFAEPERSEILELFSRHRDWLLAINEPPRTAWLKRLLIRVLGAKGAAKLIGCLGSKRAMHPLDKEDGRK